MVLKGKSKVPIVLSELGIRRLHDNEYWLIPDELAMSKSAASIAKFKFRRLIEVNPNITLKPDESVVMRTLAPIFNLTVLIIDTQGRHYLPDTGVVVVENLPQNHVKVTNTLTPANTITIHVEPLGTI